LKKFIGHDDVDNFGYFVSTREQGVAVVVASYFVSNFESFLQN